MSRLNGEGLEESNADADNTHGNAAPDQQQKAHAEAQTDLCHNESAVGGVEAINGVMPAHCWECGQDERHHPDAHHCVDSLLLGVTEPGNTQPQMSASGQLKPFLDFFLLGGFCSSFKFHTFGTSCL